MDSDHQSDQRTACTASAAMACISEGLADQATLAAGRTLYARYRVAPSTQSLLGAPPLCSDTISELPRPGSTFRHESARYTVVKVLRDVAPDHGDTSSGPIVFVVKEK